MADQKSLRARLIAAWLRLKNPILRRRHYAYLKVWLGRLVLWGGAVGVGLLAVGLT